MTVSLRLLSRTAAAAAILLAASAAPAATGGWPTDALTYRQCMFDLFEYCRDTYPTDFPARMQCINDNRAYCDTLPGAP